MFSLDTQYYKKLGMYNICCSIYPTAIILLLFKSITIHSVFHSYILQLDTFINGIIAQLFIGGKTVFKKVTKEGYVNKSVLHAQYIGTC